MTDKTTLLTAKVPSLPVNHIHPMIARACQILETYEPADSASWPTGTDTTTEALDALVAKEKIATGTLTPAQLIAATTAHTLIAAPGAGKINIVKSIELFLDYAAAFTSGSDFSILYETTSTAIAPFDVAALTGTADVHYHAIPTTYDTTAGTGGSFVASANVNKAVQLLVSGSAYAGGAGSALKYRIKYETVTVLT
jgi:hypothetical protein